MKNPYISVIVLNYNGRHFLEENIQSILSQTYVHKELIFIDNASTDDSADFLQRYSQELTLIQHTENQGFAGNNSGIERARGDYYLILNNDTVLDPEMLQEAAHVIESYPNAGMFAPKVLQYESPDIIDSVGLNIYRDAMSRQRGRFEKDIGQYDQIEELFVPSGCAAFYKREMIDMIGGIDEDFFAYCEDTDLGLRGRLAGWKTYSAPRSRVYHHFSGSWKKTYAKKAFLVERNHVWVALKSFPVILLLAAPVFTMCRYCVQVYALVTNQGIGGDFVRREAQGAWRLLLIVLWANLSALRGFPQVLKKRGFVQALKRVSTREVLSWFREYALPLRVLVFTK